MAEQTLSDINVLSLGWHIAGPYCANLLAGYGAEVIKIERPPDGDPARRMPPFFNDEPHPEKSGLFLYLNTNKRSITLNLKTERGKKIFKELVKDSDVLVENFRPRVMSGLGLDYETLAKINPRLIMVSISNFGQTGPYRDFKVTESILGAMGGKTFFTGDPEYPPVAVGGLQHQYSGGSRGSVGALIALYYRDETGEGQWVDHSMFEGMAYDVEWPAESFANRVVMRKGMRSSVTWGMYPAKDGYWGMCLDTQHWPAFMESVGEDWVKDPRFATPAGRTENSDELMALITAWALDHGKNEIYHGMQSVGAPAGVCCTAEDIVNSPQFKARGFFVELDHPVVGKLTYPGAPLKMSETPWQVGRAPLLGEHNEEVYCERLGYTREELVKLRERGVI